MTRVDILYFDGCPNVDVTADRVRSVAARLGIAINLQFIHVESAEDAVRERFLGSPTVRVNGVDVDPSAPNRSDFGLSCRMYPGAGVPSEEMIVAALTRKRSGGFGKTSGFAIVGALIATAFSLSGISLAFASLLREPVAADVPSTSLRVLKDDPGPLVAHFNATAARNRFLAILSPT